VADPTTEEGASIVGRDAELAALEAFVADEGASRALVLTGQPGVGKTTLWRAGVDLAASRGARVLAARGSGAESQHEFATLIDLLERVGGDELDDLPPHSETHWRWHCFARSRWATLRRPPPSTWGS